MKNPPSINPSSSSTLSGAFKHIGGKMSQRTDDMLPAIIISYDRATNRAIVQPQIKMISTNGDVIVRNQLASIPIMQFGGGGFVLNFPLNNGDLGWIKATDRDISLFLQSYTQVQPNTDRVHNFSDGVFIPDVMKGYSISGADSNNAVLQSLDGTIKISFGASGITVSHPTQIIFDTPSAIFSGTITTPELIFNGVHATTHVHSEVTSGTSNTGVSH